MCSALCIHHQVSAWAVSWVHLACIQVAVHVYINCTMVPLWALSWGVCHTASSPGLLPSPLEKIVCLACLPAILGGSQQPWSGKPVMSSEVVPAGRRMPSMYFDTGSMWFWGKELIYSGLQRGEMWCRLSTLSSIGLLETMLGFSALFLCPPVFSPKVQQSSNAWYWSNAHEFSMKLITFTLF